MTWLPLPLGTTVGDLPAAPTPFMGPDGVLLMTVGSLVEPYTTRELYAITARRGRFAVSGRGAVIRERAQYQLEANRAAFVITGRSNTTVRGQQRTIDAATRAFGVTGNSATIAAQKNYRLDAITATFVLTGYNNRINGRDDILISAGSEAFTASLYEPANVKSGDNVLVVGNGDYLTLGRDSVLLETIRLDATYTQSGVYPGNIAATKETMQNSNAAETLATGTTNITSGSLSWVQMDFGSGQSFTKVVVGCDFTNTLSGGWGKTYTESADIITSNDGVTWAVVSNTGTFSAAIKTLTVSVTDRRYVRIRKSGFLAVTEFYAMP